MSRLTTNEVKRKKAARFLLPLYIVHGLDPGSRLILALEEDRHLKRHSHNYTGC